MSKYTRTTLASIVKRSRSYAQVLSALGLKQTGGSQGYLKKRIHDLGLDVSHFEGQSYTEGRGHTSLRLNFRRILVKHRRGFWKENAARLRRAMLEYGFKELCAVCGLPPTWQGQPLRLQIDHQNGDTLDNRPKNLRFLCPNCHSQTVNFGSKNKRQRGGMADALA